MSRPASDYLFYDRIEGTEDIENKTYTGYSIRYIFISNDSDGTMVLTLAGKDVTILAGETWGFPCEIDKFSLDADSGAYRIDIGV
jgi:hypothetical protein